MTNALLNQKMNVQLAIGELDVQSVGYAPYCLSRVKAT
jgi:hypothetical protein